MNHGREDRDYCAYLLRCRRSRTSTKGITWRCSLENPHTGQRRMFAALEDLLDTLRRELVEETSPSDDPATPPK